MADTPPRTHDLRVGGSRVILVGTIQGLAKEGERVEEAWLSFGDQRPTAIGLGVPPNDVENLRRIGREGAQEFLSQDLDTSSYEENILPQLSRFGDIVMPPDDLLVAEELARTNEVELHALDLDDEAHADLYVEHISGWQMVRGQMKQKRLIGSAGQKAESAEHLMLIWDDAFTSIKGYGRFEAARERHMANRLREVAEDHKRVLAVVPYPRAEGMANALRQVDRS